MTVYLVKRMSSADITNGKQYETQSIKIQNATSVSIITETGVDKFSIVSGGVTSKYNVSEYVITITA